MEESREIITEDEMNDELKVICFRKPYMFEGTVYTELDLEPLGDLTAISLIEVDKQMSRDGFSAEIMPEFKLNYACHLAAKALRLPIEFFYGLPAKEALRVKNLTMGFLFGSE